MKKRLRRKRPNRLVFSVFISYTMRRRCIMIIFRSFEQIQKAALKAGIEKPALEILEYGKYAVTTKAGNRYVVTCRRDGSGQKLVFCSCEEKYSRRSGVPCYHIPPAIGIHILLTTGIDAFRKGVNGRSDEYN